MNKKILIAVDDSIHSKNAIRYASNMAAFVKDVNYTLFHVQPTISQYLLDEAEKNRASKAELKKIVEKNTEAGNNLLEEHREQMIKMGVATQSIDIVTQPRMMGLAKDILRYGHSGVYDSIVMGRRGLSSLQEAFMGSVSANVLEHSNSIPIWLIDGEVKPSKLMFAVDGSENSLKALDHIAFIMGNNTDIKVLFFHVQPKISDFCPIDFESVENDRIEELVLQGDKNCVDQFFAHALKRLKEAGLNDNQIEVKVSDALFNPGKAIIEEAKQGDYGTIVVGRRGINRTFFTGSVSRYVIGQISGKALWIVP